MQRIFLAIAFFILFFLFGGCSVQDNAPAETTIETTVTTIPVTTLPTETETSPLAIVDDPLLQVYPINAGMEYYNFAIDVPDHIFYTLGSENKLEGTIYTIEGSVTPIEPMDAAGVDVEYATVSTDKGEVIILNMYRGIFEETVTRQGISTARKLYSDNPDYYLFPDIGERAVFLVVYNGFSQSEEMPVFLLGASADIFTIMDCPDPVAAEIDTTLIN